MSMLFKRIKDWATSITAFRTGDVIPVDGPSGTAKMSKDDLLNETAENADKKIDHITASDAVSGVIEYNITSYTQYSGIPLFGSTEWYPQGKHFSIPVNEGDVIILSPDIKARFVLMDGTFVDGNKDESSPYPATTGIVTVQGGESVTLDIDATSKFLILVAVDGDGNNISWTITGNANTKLKKYADDLSSGEEQVDVASLIKYEGSIRFSYQKAWYYYFDPNIEKPQHVNIPLKKNWVYEITPTNGLMSAVISDSPSYDKKNNDPISGKIVYCKQDETVKVVGTGSNYLSVTVVDGGGKTLTFNVVAKFKGDNAVEEIPLYTERCVNYKGLPRYDKPMTWYPAGKYVVFEVSECEIITLSPSIDCYFVVCNDTFVPRNFTSTKPAETEISSRQFSRIPIKRGEKVTITIASDEKYLVVNTEDGDGNSVTWEISSRSKPKTSTKTKFKIAHWNIGHFSMGTTDSTTITAANKAEKQAEYRALINSVGADILAVCEDDYYFATDKTKSRLAIYDCYSKCRIGYQVTYNANSLYFNIGEMVDERSWEFTQQDMFRYVHEVRLNINGQNVVIAETHLDWSNATKRRAQIAELITHYSNEKYVIISGDWNVQTYVSDYDALKTAGYTLSLDDYLPALPTYPDKETCLDLVAVKGFTVGKSEVNTESISLSDHNLVTCELTMIS